MFSNNSVKTAISFHLCIMSFPDQYAECNELLTTENDRHYGQCSY